MTPFYLFFYLHKSQIQEQIKLVLKFVKFVDKHLIIHKYSISTLTIIKPHRIVIPSNVTCMRK
jgi:hypothetical protein